ncbi:hypothetical protein MFUL124B02_28225 [Myxococcus fulvus 124B02]|nr:hypothetical protein MFUL124B02_28225 [Myxococcus fulvus 124B02]
MFKASKVKVVATRDCFAPHRRNGPHRYYLDYILMPTIAGQERVLMACGCNPSTATRFASDKTVSKLVNVARQWGFTRLLMANVFSYCDKNPATLRGPGLVLWDRHTDRFLKAMAANADAFLCCWGKPAVSLDKARCQAVETMLRATGKPVFCLGYVKRTTIPKHPRCLKYPAVRVPWP